jgi:dihydrofolate reductase
MAKVLTALAISVDGYIAGPDDSTEQPLGINGSRLFDWFFQGDTPSKFYRQFQMSASSAQFFDAFTSRCGAIITGRRTYDLVNGWSGTGPLPGTPLFVLTHREPEERPVGDPPYVYVTDGIESAVQQAMSAAQGKDVGVMGSAGVQQCLRAGLLDEIHLHLVPVLLGSGVRLFDHLGPDHIELKCIGVVDAPGVTHVSYRVQRDESGTS